MEKLQDKYKKIQGDHFPPNIEMKFGYDDGDVLLNYQKVGWTIDGETKGLRYGDNPGQEAALYRLTKGSLHLGNVMTILPGNGLISDAELIQSGKHPGKINITDVDNALNIVRYFHDQPAVAIMKHNNPCGVAIGETPIDAYEKAYWADRLAAFGGTVAVNRSIGKQLAERIAESYSEVVVAPEYEEGALEIFAKKKNLRVMKIGNMDRLQQWIGEVYVNFKSLMDGGIILETSYVPQAITIEDIKNLPLGYHETKKGIHTITRQPTQLEYEDLWFGWLVESGITSNSVIYVKDGATVGIATGEQDRVGAAEIARDKAYNKLLDALCFKKLGFSHNEFKLKDEKLQLKEYEMEMMQEIADHVQKIQANLKGAIMVSDAFFPFRDGADVGLREGVSAIIQPGGSERDYETIDACNEKDATMIYTGQRSFKH
jgi:phosphoribosylaminoimidazolecarboxamide formyltransferase / IMP cyclohydrolase